VFNNDTTVRRDTTVKDSLLKDSSNFIKKRTIYNFFVDSVTKKPHDCPLKIS